MLDETIFLKIKDFVATEWHQDEFWRASEIATHFDIDRGNTRYYLNRLVRLGMLISIHYEHVVSYGLPTEKNLAMMSTLEDRADGAFRTRLGETVIEGK